MPVKAFWDSTAPISHGWSIFFSPKQDECSCSLSSVCLLPMRMQKSWLFLLPSNWTMSSLLIYQEPIRGQDLGIRTNLTVLDFHYIYGCTIPWLHMHLGILFSTVSQYSWAIFNSLHVLPMMYTKELAVHSQPLSYGCVPIYSVWF